MTKKVVITGGAGYIGSMLSGVLLARGYHVTVIDTLWFGGQPVLGYQLFPQFQLVCRDIATADDLAHLMDGATAVVHLAAVVGFPASQKIGADRTRQINVTGTERVYQAAQQAEVERFIFASSYSNYGRADDDRPVTEESPVYPQSIYAETKIEAEQYLLRQTDGPASTCLRLATVFGISPRTRFDLMVNQFTLEAFQTRKLVIFQQDFRRSFIHVRDVAEAMTQVIEADLVLVGQQIFNVGSEALNSSKRELVTMLQMRWSDLVVEYRDLNFGGDMRSLHVSYQKIRTALNFAPQYTISAGIQELCYVLENNLIVDPEAELYRNHPPIVV